MFVTLGTRVKFNRTQAGVYTAYLRLSKVNILVQYNHNDYSHQRSPPVDEEHHCYAQQSPQQGHPLIVVLKRGTPSGRACQRCRKHCIVDESIYNEEEVGNNGCNDIQISNGNESCSHKESQDVAPARFIAWSITNTKERDVREEVVFADCLECFGCSNKTCECRRQGGCKDSCRHNWTPA